MSKESGGNALTLGKNSLGTTLRILNTLTLTADKGL
jgi:hypothetical protein